MLYYIPGLTSAELSLVSLFPYALFLIFVGAKAAQFPFIQHKAFLHHFNLQLVTIRLVGGLRKLMPAHCTQSRPLPRKVILAAAQRLVQCTKNGKGDVFSAENCGADLFGLDRGSFQHFPLIRPVNKLSADMLPTDEADFQFIAQNEEHAQSSKPAAPTLKNFAKDASTDLPCDDVVGVCYKSVSNSNDLVTDEEASRRKDKIHDARNHRSSHRELPSDKLVTSLKSSDNYNVSPLVLSREERVDCQSDCGSFQSLGSDDLDQESLVDCLQEFEANLELLVTSGSGDHDETMSPENGISDSAMATDVELDEAELEDPALDYELSRLSDRI